ncbi:hypothetical protein KAT60_03155, partial [Candidatus Woesebacteria bacterium]|nr:hypothetical protein [Candidatus Woesebacteria bacterium]
MNNNYKDKKIKDILEELYLIDSGFRQYEGDLRKLIEKLLVIRPDTKLDDNFKRELRVKLLKRIEEIRSQKEMNIGRFLDFLFNPKFSYALSGAVLSLLLLIPVVYYVNKSGYLIGRPEADLTPIFSINSVSDDAFGSLLGRTQEEVPAQGLGGGGREGTVTTPGVMPPGPVSYSYTYRGDDLVIEQDRVEVLKRKKGSDARSGITNLVNSMDFGIMDLSTFKDSRLD